MELAEWRPAVAVILAFSSLVGSASGGDHRGERELPLRC